MKIQILNNIMIFGIGIDICDQKRIERTFIKFGDRFIDKLCLPYEKKIIGKFNQTKKIIQLSKLFAYKEAAAKALGTGFAEGINLKSFLIKHDEKGKPSMLFEDSAKKTLFTKINSKYNLLISDLKNINILISSSDDDNLTVCTVMIEVLLTNNQK